MMMIWLTKCCPSPNSDLLDATKFPDSTTTSTDTICIQVISRKKPEKTMRLIFVAHSVDEPGSRQNRQQINRTSSQPIYLHPFSSAVLQRYVSAGAADELDKCQPLHRLRCCQSLEVPPRLPELRTITVHIANLLSGGNTATPNQSVIFIGKDFFGQALVHKRTQHVRTQSASSVDRRLSRLSAERVTTDCTEITSAISVSQSIRNLELVSRSYIVNSMSNFLVFWSILYAFYLMCFHVAFLYISRAAVSAWVTAEPCCPASCVQGVSKN